MQQITYFCDRCGKQITDFVRIVYLETEPVADGEDESLRGPELCKPCSNEILNMTEWMVQNPKVRFDNGRPTGQLPGREPKNRKEIDHGKLGALAAAGWTQSKIADELGISVATVHKYIDKDLKAYNDGAFMEA